MTGVTNLLADHVFCHFFLAHAADGELSDEEIMAVRASIRPMARRLGFDEHAVDGLVTDGIDTYWDMLATQGPPAVIQTYRAAMDRLLAAVGQGLGAGRIVDTLAQVAAADGHTDDMEALLIEGVVRRWESLRAA